MVDWSTYCTHLFLWSHCFPVSSSTCQLNSINIVFMLLALSQVTWPIWEVELAIISISQQSSHLMHNSKLCGNFVQCLSKPCAVVCTIHSCEAQKSHLDLPASNPWFLDPWTCHCKIRVCVWCLPGITHKVDLTLDTVALPSWILV